MDVLKVYCFEVPFAYFRRLGDEMRSMSLEKSRQREVELAQEIERLQMEIKTLQKNSEEAANVNQQLSKEVRILLNCTLGHVL